MSVQVEKLEKNMAKLTIEVSAEDFNKALTKAYNKSKSRISVPGFRKGKAPQVMIEKMYGASVFYEDAANDIIPTAYENAAKECDLEIVSTPSIDVVQIEKGKPFIFTAEVAVKPEVTLGQYKGIEVEKTEVEVTDEEVDEEVKKVQEQNARELTVDRPAEKDDSVIIDYAGSVNGELFDGGSAEGYELVLGSGTFIPGFEDQLIGAKAGDDVDVHVTFPEEYGEKSLAGKEALFKVKVHEVKTKEYPEIDDEFAQDVSDFDTLAEYKEDVKKNLLEKKEAEAKEAKKQKVIDAVIEGATMEIPDAMVETQAGHMVEEYAQRLSYQGLSLDQYFQFTGLNFQTLKDQLKPQALRNIQNRLVLEAVAAAEDLTVSDEAYEAELQKMADAYKMDIEKIKEIIDDEQADVIKKDMIANSALDLITDAAVEK